MVGAVCQAIVVADRINHIGWMAYKFGPGPQLITAGSSATILFFGGSTFLIVLGILTARRLRASNSPLYYCSFFSITLLATGALVWGSLLASPLIKIVER
jgi:hypothetical protein